MRIALRDRDFDLMRRLLLGERREEKEGADDDGDDDDEHYQSRHGRAFAERGSRCIALCAYGSGKASRPGWRPRRPDGCGKIDRWAAPGEASRPALYRQRF